MREYVHAARASIAAVFAADVVPPLALVFANETNIDATFRAGKSPTSTKYRIIDTLLLAPFLLAVIRSTADILIPSSKFKLPSRRMHCANNYQALKHKFAVIQAYA